MNMFKKVSDLIKKRKILFGFVCLVIIVGGYFGYRAVSAKNASAQTYVRADTERGTIVVSVSGTGQVLSLDEVDIKSGASGDLIYWVMENGQAVSRGSLLAKIDTTDLEKQISDSQISLEQVQLNLDKMKGMTTEQGTLRGVKEKAQDNLDKAYENGFNDVADIFLNLPGIMSGLSDILFSYNFAYGQWNIDYYNDAIRAHNFEADIYRTDAFNKYQEAKADYDKNFQDYKLTNRYSSDQDTEALIEETYQTVKNVSEAVKSANNLIQFYQDELISKNLTPKSLSNTHLSSISGYTGKLNGYLSSLLSSSDSIKSNKEALIETDFDIKDQEIKVAQAKSSLNDLKEKLADYSVYAPFSGVIAQTNAKKGDSVSSGATLATIITKQKVAEISLNEVDASRVKAGQKVTLTFDAVDDLTVTGSVVEIDSLGTVSQGVVTYNAKISLDNQDERIKTGMSVSASIIVDVKQDVIIVPNAAVKSQSDSYYVEVIEEGTQTPQIKPVEIGIADDSFTEIISGISEGEKVVVKTVDNSNQASKQTATGSILNVGGGSSSGKNTGAGGAGVMMIR